MVAALMVNNGDAALFKICFKFISSRNFCTSYKSEKKKEKGSAVQVADLDPNTIFTPLIPINSISHTWLSSALHNNYSLLSASLSVNNIYRLK